MTDGATGGRSGLTVDELAASLQNRILLGEIPVGTPLRQQALAEEYGVSRTPVREALRKLQTSGLVILRPNQGAVVRGPSARDIREAYQVRAELEALAAQQAARWISGPQLDSLREAEELFRHAVEAPRDRPRDDWTHANDLFHDAVLAAAGNDRLRSVVLELHRTFPRSLTWAALVDDPRRLLANVEEHGWIRGAIERHDGPAARRLMEEHVLNAGELIARWFERRDGA